ncbi:MAG TPA: XdhC family protein [Gemmataceae bacterium]|nr:XdhC family protein [Gemmataceae bacterium]
MRELLGELTAAISRRLSCVYCAVVETRGSTPQKAGAAMLVYPDGTQAGTLGGGCVEAEVKRRALHSLNDAGRPEVLTFCLDDDYGWDDGLICGGRMTILAHAVTADASGYYQRLRELADGGAGFTEAVVIGDAAGLPVGDRYLFDATGKSVAHIADRPAWEAVSANLTALSSRPQPVTRRGIAYLPALPRVTLFLVGGGHVGQAVATLASDVGFEVWVLDDREKFASPERFPTASRRIVGDIGMVLRDLAPSLTPATFAVILTRGHSHDEEALYHLANTPCGYVGMIGSKRKIRMIFEDLVAKGIKEEALARVHAPLGYNIGSQTVPEIAVSIVAELIACRNTGKGDSARSSWERKKETRGCTPGHCAGQ